MDIRTEHPDTSWPMNSLALLWESNGNIDEAVKLHDEAQRAQALTLGDSYSHTIWSVEAVVRLRLTKRMIVKKKCYFGEMVG